MPIKTVKFTIENVVMAVILLVILTIGLANYVGYKQYTAKYDVACVNLDSQTCTDFLFNEK